MKTLTVIDMQEEFTAANCPDTIAEVKKLCRKARRNKWPIILVEYAGAHQTLEEIQDVVKGYGQAFTLTKNKDDGSDVISKFVAGKNLPDGVVACGVNTQFCVHDTVRGLLEKNHRVEVVKKACNGPTWKSTTPERYFALMERHGAVLS